MEERKIDKHKGLASENRLKQEFERLDLHQSTNLLSLEREKVNLQSELRGLRHTSGHHEPRGKTGMSLRGSSIKSGKVRRLFKSQGFSKPSLSSSFNGTLLEQDGISSDLCSPRGSYSPKHKRSKNGSHTKPAPQLIERDKNVPDRLPEIQTITSNLTVKGLTEANSNKAKRNLRLNSMEIRPEEYIPSEKKHVINNEVTDSKPRTSSINESPTGLRPESRNLSILEQSLSTSWYNTIGQARSNVHKRLSNSMLTLETGSVGGATNEDSRADNNLEMSAYLYAPPDGLPRTMYIMPSEDERFSQARQARYIRRPGTKLNPVEKELDLDDIFGNTDRNNDKY